MRAAYGVFAGLALVMSVAAPNAVQGAQAAGADDTYYRAAIGTLADDLAKDYVFADIGRRYAELLRINLARGSYRGITDPAEISSRLTDDLRSLHQDLHVHVRPESSPPNAGNGPANPPIEGIAWLAPGIAYIRFNLFPGTPGTVAQTRKFVLDHANARAVIIDARHNHGGGGAEMNVMLPYFFAQQTEVVDMELSSDVAQAQGFAADHFLRAVPASPGKARFAQIVEPDSAEHRLFGAKVFYLVSQDTGSAAEALGFIFKITRRAVLVGEHTRGMNHFGRDLPLGQGLECFVPMGRTFDPKTGADWEGSGVMPDVAAPPDDALRVALTMAQR